MNQIFRNLAQIVRLISLYVYILPSTELIMADPMEIKENCVKILSLLKFAIN